ncbi:hypothetical protein BJ875DRAFT_385852, partial [Amylocarpus encephaloides]
ESFPLKLTKGQCPIYISDESKSYKERIGSFYRPTKMIDHVKRIHLKRRDLHAKIECYHLGLVLEHVKYFKGHVKEVHGIKLRELRFIRPLK